MLQNAPPPTGSGLPVDVVLEVARSVDAIAYVKEEAMPSGARITRLLDGAPATLRGVLGGAGGRYITDELARGATGTMPAVELAEMHVALFAAHRAGDGPRAAPVQPHAARAQPAGGVPLGADQGGAAPARHRRARGQARGGPRARRGRPARARRMPAELADVLDPPVRAAMR
jgi:hypothetical protein